MDLHDRITELLKEKRIELSQAETQKAIHYYAARIREYRNNQHNDGVIENETEEKQKEKEENNYARRKTNQWIEDMRYRR